MIKNLSMLILLALFLAFPLTAQEKNDSATSGSVSDEELEQLHSTLRTLVEDYISKRKDLQEKEELIFTMDMGLRDWIEERSAYTFREEARFKLSGGKPVELTFYYTQTYTDNLYTQTRWIINPGLEGKEVGGIKVRYESNMDKSSEHTLSELKSDESRSHMLLIYKKYLHRMITMLQMKSTYEKEDERLDVNKMLYLGEY